MGNKPGRPEGTKKPAREKRKMVSVRLPWDLCYWLRRQPAGPTKTIEKALTKLRGERS